MTTSTITTIPDVPVDAMAAPWEITDDAGGAAILHHDFPPLATEDGEVPRSLDYWLPRRAIPVDFDGHQATINVDPAEVVRWATFVDHVKADVVFSAKPDVLLLWFALNLDGITAVENVGRVDLLDEGTGALVGVLPRPFLLDAERNRHDCDWTVGAGYLECTLPDLDPSLYLGAVFDPTTIDTSTATVPTAYSNQKKHKRLSNGYLIAILATTTTNAELWYSTDNGGTWTQYAGADIAGWSDGSFDTYVDSPGNVERIVVAWKQSGTGGGRTDNQTYCMVGTFNAGRTTITWVGTGTAISGESEIVFPDVAAHPEGTGGVAHFVGTRQNTADAVYYRRAIDSAGALGALAGGTSLSGAGAVTGSPSARSWASICINLADKRLHVTWSNNALGTNKGQRYRTAAYSTGSWTWASEVEVSTAYAPAAPSRGVTCRWDGTRIVIAGLLTDAGTTDTLVIWDSTNFTSFTNRIATATTLYGFSFDVDVATGDVYCFGSGFNGSAYTNAQYRKATRSGAALSLGSIVVLEAFTGSASNPAYVSAVYTSVSTRIDLIYTKGSSSPYDVRYETILFNQPPTAPTWTTSAGAKDVNASLALQATNNDPNPGDTVSAYALKRDIAGTIRWYDGSDWDATTLTWVTDTDLDVTLASGWGVDGGDAHNYYIAAKDAAGAGDPPVYSSALVITPSAKINPVIDEPDDGETVGTATKNAEWTVAEMSAYLLELLNAAGDTVLWTPGWVTGVVARVRTIAYTLANGDSYKLRLTTKNADGLTSDPDIVDFDVDYVEPATPILDVDTSDNLKAILTITNPAPVGDQPAAASNRIWRRPEGDTSDGRLLVDSSGTPIVVASDGSHDDWYIGSLETFEWRVETTGANGTVTFGAWTS